MTHRILFVAVAAAALMAAGPSLAQDDQNSWQGFYAGLNAGGTWGDTSRGIVANGGNGAIVIPPADIATINAIGVNGSNSLGFTGGIEGGYNYRTGPLLLGLETDFDFLNVSQTRSKTFTSPVLISPPLTYTVGQKVSTNWMWTVRPRIGYVSGRWLFYGTAGLAMTDAKLTLAYADTRVPANILSAATTQTKTGWTGGAGVGYALSPHWSMKAEFLYADFGAIHVTATAPSGFVTLVSSTQIKSQIVRVGVDYKF